MPIPKLFEVPNERLARSKAHQETAATYTIACKHCKKPLWTVSDIKTYGTKVSAKKKAFPGVPEYNDIWSKDGRECKQINCPFCQEQWFDAIQAQGKIFPRPYVLEFDT